MMITSNDNLLSQVNSDEVHVEAGRGIRFSAYVVSLFRIEINLPDWSGRLSSDEAVQYLQNLQLFATAALAKIADAEAAGESDYTDTHSADQCPSCDFSGYDGYEADYAARGLCGDCHGFGVVDADNSPDDDFCPTCRGTGFAPIEKPDAPRFALYFPKVHYLSYTHMHVDMLWRRGLVWLLKLVPYRRFAVRYEYIKDDDNKNAP